MNRERIGRLPQELYSTMVSPPLTPHRLLSTPAAKRIRQNDHAGCLSPPWLSGEVTGFKERVCAIPTDWKLSNFRFVNVTVLCSKKISEAETVSRELKGRGHDCESRRKIRLKLFAKIREWIKKVVNARRRLLTLERS
ncbi:unnamed protein product [Strongylus vulgaris]|uniref:Uncharacterized protein n=1 Tax=Strongylus vulgaris TaxID=40348 RepID=A0A3P7JQ37_STRVU|nr:unnamed protein product [Strongylus vulgaris]